MSINFDSGIWYLLSLVSTVLIWLGGRLYGKRWLVEDRPRQRAILAARVAQLEIELTEQTAKRMAADRQVADLTSERAGLVEELRLERIKTHQGQALNDRLAYDVQAGELLIDELQQQYDEDIYTAREHAQQLEGLLYLLRNDVPGVADYLERRSTSGNRSPAAGQKKKV